MLFTTNHQLDSLIDAYFMHIAGQFHLEEIPAKGKTTGETMQQKVWDRDPEPPTISGLILFLGFESRAIFDTQERKGKFSESLQRAKLRIETEYEKKLHQQAPSGAIFALKNLGWNDKDSATGNTDIPKKLKVEVKNTPIPVSSNEKDIVL